MTYSEKLTINHRLYTMLYESFRLGIHQGIWSSYNRIKRLKDWIEEEIRN